MVRSFHTPHHPLLSMKKLATILGLVAVTALVIAAKKDDVTFPNAAALSSYSSVIQTFLGTSTAAAARASLGVAETATNSVIPLAKGGTASATATAARGVLGVRAMVAVTSGDGTVTNTFTTPFAITPCIAQVPFNTDTIQTNTVRSITTSNYVADLGAHGVTFYYIAIERDSD